MRGAPGGQHLIAQAIVQGVPPSNDPLQYVTKERDPVDRNHVGISLSSSQKKELARMGMGSVAVSVCPFAALL